MLNRKFIFGTDLFQYLSLSFFLSDKSNMHPAIVFRAKKKKTDEIHCCDEYFFVHALLFLMAI